MQKSPGLTLQLLVLHDQFTVGIQSRTKVHFAERNLGLFSEFKKRAETDRVYTRCEGSREIKMYTLVFKQKYQKLGKPK